MRGDIVPPKRPSLQQPMPRKQNEPAVPQQPTVILPQPQMTDVQKVPQAEPVDRPILAQQAPSQDVQHPVDQIIDSQTNVPENERQTSLRTPWYRKRVTQIGVGIVILLAIAVIFALGWYSYQISAVDPRSEELMKVTIEPGSGTAGIAATLKQSGLIRSETAFKVYVRLSSKAGALQTGAYRLSKKDDVASIVRHLTTGKTDTFSLTFLPGATLIKHRQVLIDAGYTAEQVDAALNKKYSHPLFASKPDGADLEGYIYGETYNFDADTTPEAILTRTFDQYYKVIQDNKLIERYAQRGFTLYQGITLASIIQREVASPSDAAQVAQVFELRLKADTLLGSDVTYQYIADKTGQARSVDLDSPYNTRRYKGLPPGPISSPGTEALKSVGNPASGDYLFFLSGDDDKTYLARTYEEHQKNIRDHCKKKCEII